MTRGNGNMEDKSKSDRKTDLGKESVRWIIYQDKRKQMSPHFLSYVFKFQSCSKRKYIDGGWRLFLSILHLMDYHDQNKKAPS